MIRGGFLAGVLALALLAAAPAGAGEPTCPALPEVAAPEAVPGALPRVAAAIASGRLDVLAIGSGTVLGARGRPEGSFPDRMAEDLRAALPGVEIRLVVQGARGMPATTMLAALRRDLAAGSYRLVLWQTGTAEAVRKVPPEEFAYTLDGGAEAVRAAGADLLLVDPQYSRMLQTHADLPPYQQAMREAAAHYHAVLFHRFDLGRQWAESGGFDLETAAVPDRPQMAAELNACLGHALAAAVLRAAGPQRP